MQRVVLFFDVAAEVLTHRYQLIYNQCRISQGEWVELP